MDKEAERPIPSIFPNATVSSKTDHGEHGEIEFWINVLNRYSCRDSERFNKVEDRIRRLERPWWKRMVRPNG